MRFIPVNKALWNELNTILTARELNDALKSLASTVGALTGTVSAGDAPLQTASTQFALGADKPLDDKLTGDLALSHASGSDGQPCDNGAVCHAASRTPLLTPIFEITPHVKSKGYD